MGQHFACACDPGRVTIDLSHSNRWDASSVTSLDSILDRFRRRGIDVTLTGLDPRSARLYERLSEAGEKART